jgi:ATP-dependent Clp endopeptidase proteolytic subunit ClpP
MKEEKYWGEIPNKDRVKPSKKRGGEGDYKHIAVNENKIYFYAGVNRDSAVELNKKVGELQSKSFSLANNLDIEPPGMHLYINSGGGSITAGISSMDTILRCKVPVHTYVDGFAASAATFLSIAGTKRYMSRNSYMLIHQLSTNFWGKYSEFEDEKQNLDLMMETIKRVYKEYTKVPMRKIDEILKHDLLWDAETCKSLGLIDEII